MLILRSFCAAQNRSFKSKFNLKTPQNWVIFAKNAEIFFAFFFWNPRRESQILTPHPWPPFWTFFIRCIEQWAKTFCKKPIDRSGQKPVNRPVNRRRFRNLPVWSRKSWPVSYLVLKMALILKCNYATSLQQNRKSGCAFRVGFWLKLTKYGAGYSYLPCVLDF